MNAAADPIGLRRALTVFLAEVDQEAVSADIVERTGGDPEAVAKLLDTYLEEAVVGLDLIADALRDATDVLEIGAGVGALSTFLATQGWRVVAVEPVGTGFDFVGAARMALAAQWGRPTHCEFHTIDAAHLGPEHGEFDLAFSVHVLEHVTDLDGVITAVQRRVRPTGRSIHTCPNYTVPYEPHFGVPLVPFRPAVTGRLLADRTSTSPLWKSLNFVTAGDVRAISRRAGIAVAFEPGVMAASAERVKSDENFRERQGLAGKLAALVVSSRPGRWILERWPAGFSTPMVFVLTGVPSEPSASAAVKNSMRGMAP